jgi:hypothetical protein
VSEQVKTAKRCDECIYYHATGKTVLREKEDFSHESVAYGECRCGPPRHTQSLSFDTKRWPPVYCDEWCGVHMKPDPGD